MDRLEAMSLLVGVAEAGSFSAAGRRLGVPLPTISRKIAELEAHLKSRLFVRSTRKLVLTEAGAAYLEAARRILEEVEEAERAAAGEYRAPRGHLAVAAPIVFGRHHVRPVVEDFLAGFPDIDVQLVLSDRNAHLIEDQIDVAVRIGHLSDSTMVATRVGAVRRTVCGSPDFFARHGVPARPADLAGLPCVTFELPGTSGAWSFGRPGHKRAEEVAIRARLSVNTAEAAIDAAVAGVGVTRVLSYQAAPAIREGTLQIVLEAFEPDPLPVHVLHAGGARLPLKIRSFLDVAVPKLRRDLAGLTRL